MKDIITKMIEGSVDFHIHVSPDPFVERIADANEVALQAKNIGMKGVVLKSHTYPTAPLAQMAGTSLDLRFQKELAERGAFIEHCFVATMPLYGRLNPLQIVEAIRFVGAEKCLLSTDFGQLPNPPPWEGMRMMLVTLLQCGLSEKELHILVKENPYRFLNL